MNPALQIPMALKYTRLQPGCYSIRLLPTLTLISGLDRFVNVKVTRETGAQLYNTTTTRTGVADRLKAADGSEFYGKKVTLPALGKETDRPGQHFGSESVSGSYV
jgi:hypothetical protein